MVTKLLGLDVLQSKSAHKMAAPAGINCQEKVV